MKNEIIIDPPKNFIESTKIYMGISLNILGKIYMGEFGLEKNPPYLIQTVTGKML